MPLTASFHLRRIPLSCLAGILALGFRCLVPTLRVGTQRPGRSASLSLTACIACLLLTGCETSVVPVSGRVTLDGKPLAGAVVTFQPRADGPASGAPAAGSVGRTDEDGRYTLHVIKPDQPGAAVGEHTVTISPATGGSDKEPAKGQTLPKNWYDGSKKFKVPPGGTSEANFKIATPPAGKKPKAK